MVSPDNNNTTNDWGSVEPDMTAAHARVRSALKTLPKATCPVGFEFRLERKLAGKPVGETRKSWSMGWLGAGVGFATAMVLAVFVFDFGGTTISPAGMVPTATKSGSAVEQPATITPTTEQPMNMAQEKATPKESEQLAATPDSMKDKTKPGTLPDGNYQVVNKPGGGR